MSIMTWLDSRGTERIDPTISIGPRQDAETKGGVTLLLDSPRAPKLLGPARVEEKPPATPFEDTPLGAILKGKRVRRTVNGAQQSPHSRHISPDPGLPDPQVGEVDSTRDETAKSIEIPGTGARPLEELRFGRTIAGRIFLALLLAVVIGIVVELKTYRIQAEVFSWLTQKLQYGVADGLNRDLQFPTEGPYDRRLGYSRIPDYQSSLLAQGFDIEAQALHSPALAQLVAWGGSPPYREKSRAGLSIVDRAGRPFYTVAYPERAYERFEQVPPVLGQSLLFIENRELLDPSQKTRNPAIEWDRLAVATFGQVKGLLGLPTEAGGGSTLATQIEKFRHSRGGRTEGPVEKLRQIASASLRAYVDGPDTTDVRRRILVDYLNNTPLGGRAGFGEVNGLAAGLEAWFDADFDKVNELLHQPLGSGEVLAQQALAYKQALSLLLAQRRPQAYLINDREALRRLSNSYLALLAEAGVIPQMLSDAAAKSELRFREALPPTPEISFVEQKASNAIRAELMTALGESSAYDLDRLDLAVETTIDGETQAAVTEVLRDLADPSQVRARGLTGARLLGSGDPAKVVYSVTLFERSGSFNHVRVQADTLDQPFDLNRGAKLDLGSTAKLRTLTSYLQIIETLHKRHGKQETYQLDAIARDPPDVLTDWAVRFLAKSEDRSLRSILAAAMLREYSASPIEKFFTGGGVHEFENFNSDHDSGVFTVAESIRHSINLPFVRLMRDMVDFLIAEGGGRGRDLLSDKDHPARRAYLARYADQDGSIFIDRFHRIYKELEPEQARAKLVDKVRRTPKRMATVFRSLDPEADQDALGGFLKQQLGAGMPSEKRIARLYDNVDPAKVSLIERAALIGLHPLELWLVSHLQQNPEASRRDLLKASRAERQAVMAWLTESNERHGDQNLRIWTILEQEAFQRLHRDWQRLGYPFESLVPSFATSIGSSADRPDALAELIGIIMNDGLRLPNLRVERLHFAKATPYETVVGPAVKRSKRVLSPAIAEILRGALVDVVDNGTARRAKGVLSADDGTTLPIGGKTGTGDNRFKTYGAGGKLIEDRVVNRTATFVFFLGDRFFGTITAYVDGEEAGNYGFTSSLPTALLRQLAPAFQSLLQAPVAANAQASG